jgi:lambda repressor-like predicted transcriptional regulator
VSICWAAANSASAFGTQRSGKRRIRLDLRSDAHEAPLTEITVVSVYSGPWAKTESRQAATKVIWSSRFASQADSRCSLRRHAAHFACPTDP